MIFNSNFNTINGIKLFQQNIGLVHEFVSVLIQFNGFYTKQFGKTIVKKEKRNIEMNQPQL